MSDGGRPMRGTERNCTTLHGMFVKLAGPEVVLPEGRIRVVEELTPLLAKRLLENQWPGQRELRERNVRYLSKCQKDGRYAWTGDPIRLAANDLLIDGQHRCSSVVSTGLSLRHVVLINVADEQAFRIIDTGTVRRTVRDVQGFMGGRRLENTVNAAVLFEAFDFNQAAYAHLRPGDHEEIIAQCVVIEQAIELHREGRREVGLTRGPLAGALRCVKVDPQNAMKFFLAVFGNTALIDGHFCQQAKFLSDVIIKQQVARSTDRVKMHAADTQAELAEKAIRAYNAWRSGRQISVLKAIGFKVDPVEPGQ